MAKTMTLAQMRRMLKKLTPGTHEYSAMKYAIMRKEDETLAAPAPGSSPGPAPKPEKSGGSSSPKASSISFNYDEMAKQAGFTPSERNVKAMSKRAKTVPEASFISGGTPAQKAALAKKIANMTITKGMSAADAAKIRKARLWYTGQTEGRHGKTAAVYKQGSVKDQLLGGKKGSGKPKPPKQEPHITLTGQNRAGTTADIAAFMTAGQNPAKPRKPRKR